MHARGVEVLVLAAPGMHAVEAADDVAVDHVDDRFGDRLVERLEGMHAFLDEHLGDFQAFLDHAHLVALLAVEGDHLVGVAHRHHAHAVGAGIGLDDDVRRLGDAVLLVFFLDDVEYGSDVGGQAFLALPFVEVDRAADREGRVDAPRVDADGYREIIGDLVVGREMVGFAAHRPAGVQRRQHVLFVETGEDLGNARREVVIEQDGTRLEAGDAEPVAVADQRFEQQLLAVRQVDRHRFDEIRDQRADAHVEPGLGEDGGDLGDVLQVELVARVVFRDQQQRARFRTEFLDGAHRGLHAERQEGRVEVVETAREEVGIDRRQLEAGVAQIDRGIKGRRVLLPLAAQPVFDLGAVFQELAFEFEEGAGEGGCQVWNHEAVSKSRSFYCGRKSYTAVHKFGPRPHGQPVENR